MLRGPPVSWAVIAGDVELSAYGDAEEGRPDPAPWASIEEACAGALRGEERSATLEGRLDGFRETVDVHWICADGIDEGCACSATPNGRGASWVALLVLIGRWRRARGAVS